MSDNSEPIGVFDSGLGGLTVVKELIWQMPNEHIVYYGDTARVPYGTKSRESIIRFSHENVEILLKYNVKMVVVACNSSSSYAMKDLRKGFSVPMVGVIHPGAQAAVKMTRNNRVGVIATSATIQSGEYARTIGGYNKRIKVFGRACPLFVPLAEEGWFHKEVTEKIAREYLAPLKKARIDTLILGCTHYPLLKKTIQKVMGEDVKLIDSARTVAKQVKSVLEETKRQRQGKAKARHKFLISDRPQEFESIAKKFLGDDISKSVKYV